MPLCCRVFDAVGNLPTTIKQTLPDELNAMPALAPVQRRMLAALDPKMPRLSARRGV